MLKKQKKKSLEKKSQNVQFKCAVCGITIRPAFAKKLSEPSLAEGSGILSSVVDTATKLFTGKGIPYLAKRGIEAGRYYTSEATWETLRYKRKQ